MTFRSVIYLFVFLSTVLAATTPTTPAKTVLLADGRSMQYGNLTNGEKWQASGVLYQGCTPPTWTPSTAFNISSSNCYALSLSSSNTSQLDPGFESSPRQRVEFRVPSITFTPKTPSTKVYNYTFKSYLTPGVSTSTKFFHLMQVFDEDQNTPLVALSAVNNTVTMSDFRNATGLPTLPVIPIANFTGKTLLHKVLITPGSAKYGMLNYSVWDVNAPVVAKVAPKPMLEWNVKGFMGNGSVYLKYGAYRATFFPNMTVANMSVGEFTSA